MSEIEEQLTESGRLDEYGIGSQLRPATTAERLLVGKTRTFARLNAQEWGFLGCSTVALLGTIGLTVDRMVEYSGKEELASDLTFSILLLINACFCLLYVYSGVLLERQFELYAFIAAYMVVLTYCIFEYCYNVERRNNIKLARMIVGSVLCVPCIGLAILVAQNFGWLEFRIVGASESLQYMYRQTCIFSSLLKFDLQAASSFIVLVLRGSLEVNLVETITLSVGIPLSFIWFILGWVAIRMESKVLTLLFIGLSFLEPAYVMYRISTDYLSLYGDSSFLIDTAAVVMPTDIVLYSELVAGGVAFTVRSVTLVELMLVVRNYGMGLRERAFPNLTERSALLSDKPRRLL